MADPHPPSDPRFPSPDPRSEIRDPRFPQDLSLPNMGNVQAAAVADEASYPPPLSADQLAVMSPEEKDRWWYQNVYRGDHMPQLTVRAVLLGGVLGMLMSASNLYTTLTVGWAFGVAITSCVMSYVIWNFLRLISAGSISKMSILENNCMQSTASAAGYSTGSTIATMFGALLLLQDGDSASIKTWVVQNPYLVAGFTLLTGALGVFLAIPMKRQMINHEQLPFPSGIAAAETLKSLYSQSREAVHKAYAMVAGIGVGIVVGILKTPTGALAFLDKVLPFRLPGQLPDQGLRLYHGKQLVGYGFEPSVLLIGAGMIVGLRISLSMLVGSLLLYVVVAPYLIGLDFPHMHADGVTFDPGYIPSIEIVGGGTVYHVYRWGLWGGTGLMVFASLTSLALQWRTVGRAVSGVFSKAAREAESHESAQMRRIEVPLSWMIAGMVPITIGMILLQMLAFDISWYAGIIAVGMAFVLALVACRATGETDTTPIGAMGKVMQLLFAGLHPGKIVPNLASAGIAANSASSSADLLTDLKSGYLLGANPRKQFLAQFIGLFFGTLAIVPIWYLMVPTKAKLESFAAPATNQWYKVAQVLTEGLDKLPDSAKWALLIGCLIGVAMPIIEKTLVPADKRKYFPSAMGLGLSWMVPFANSLAFTIGAIIAAVWGRVNKNSCEKFNVPLASGLVAGESLSAAFVAMTSTVIGLLK